jgi:hypothetical protein
VKGYGEKMRGKSGAKQAAKGNSNGVIDETGNKRERNHAVGADGLRQRPKLNVRDNSPQQKTANLKAVAQYLLV